MKNNALVTQKKVKLKNGNDITVLNAVIELDNGEKIDCEIKLNIYNKKALPKLYYKLSKHLPVKE